MRDEEMKDEEFIESFERCTLDAESFHHRDHVRLAWLYLRQSSVPEALDRFSASLKRFAGAGGNPGIYHETITWAYLLLINERMARAGLEQTWDEFAEANKDLLDWKESILKTYYREETLSSELARRVFVFPDRISSEPL
jgi:hypothetical protein